MLIIFILLNIISLLKYLEIIFLTSEPLGNVLNLRAATSYIEYLSMCVVHRYSFKKISQFKFSKNVLRLSKENKTPYFYLRFIFLKKKIYKIKHFNGPAISYGFL